MATEKMMYGIDLGTTNSVLVKMDQGSLLVIKNEVQKDTTPSCVSFTRKRSVRTGESALNGFRSDLRASLKKGQEPVANTFIEFKRTMGSDKSYYSANMEQSYSSEQLSSEVLKKLKTYVENDPFDAVVITVPAKFRQNQLDATLRAAELAGFKYVELLQEPIAASIAYGMERKNKSGFWLVFDLGGGTFDAALMKVDQGLIKVLDTEGDNHLGGKNMDYHIVDEILLPHIRNEYVIDELEGNDIKMGILRDALKSLAEEAKIQLTGKEKYELLTDEPICLDDQGDAIEIDLEITVEQFNKAVAPTYRRCLEIVAHMLARNKITGDRLETILLVGGATYSPYIRDLLATEICPRIAKEIDPMIAVAKGAALFASTRSIPPSKVVYQPGKTYLDTFYPESTMEEEVQAGIKVQQPVKNATAEFVRADGGWTSGAFPLSDGKAIVPVVLAKNRPNTFRIHLFADNGARIPTQPETFTIIQGTVIPNATLPYAICIDAYDSKRKTNLLALLPGLEKNQQLPAKGKAVFLTASEVQPGNKDSCIDISIYEGEPETRAIHNEPIGRVLITGNEVDRLVPANQEIEITLEVNASRGMKLSAYLSYIDETFEIELPENKQKEYDTDKIRNEMDRIRTSLQQLAQEKDMSNKERLKTLTGELVGNQKLLQNARGDYNTKTQVVERLRELAIEVEKIQFSYEWPRAQLELKEAFDSVEEKITSQGDENDRYFLLNWKRAAEQAILHKDIALANQLAERLHQLSMQLTFKDPGVWIMLIDNYDGRFNDINWKDAVRAKQIIAGAYANRMDTAMARSAAAQLFELLPEEELPQVAGPGKGHTIWRY